MQFIEGHRVGIKAWIDGVPVEDAAIQQLKNLTKLPFIFKHVAAMPDVHWGMGATVGSVIATDGAIIPAAVGVDIGCGMQAVKLANITAKRLNEYPTSPLSLRTALEQAVPHGRTDNGGRNDQGAWRDDVPYENFLMSGDVIEALLCEYDELVSETPELAIRRSPLTQFGTLGTGNHFLELCVDEADGLWLVVHSGSRGAGNKIGQYFIEMAKSMMQKWMIELPDPNLAYLPQHTALFGEYLDAVKWAQEYAFLSRTEMIARSLRALCRVLGRDIMREKVIDCHHNYVTRENHFGQNVFVTRKGAVCAREGMLGIIPGSMGAKSFIVRGKGNPDSFMSCSHGAGRKMSRTQAAKTFTVEDHIKATEGVACRKDASVLDETPMAYKDIDAVMAAQTDLVDVVHTLKQIVCVKG